MQPAHDRRPASTITIALAGVATKKHIAYQ